MSKCIECVDHKGNHFETQEDMCAFWKVNTSTYLMRLRMGKSLEEALTGNFEKEVCHNNSPKECVDHKGNTFTSFAEMCRYWKVSEKTTRGRLSRGWSLEKALTAKNTRHCKDHLGKEFTSEKEMAKHWGINYSVYMDRIHHGWSLEDALTIKVPEKKLYRDHEGNTFETIQEMCNFWNIDKELYRSRTRLGWSTEKALTEKRSEHELKVQDHLGNHFASITEMCNYWNIDPYLYSQRVSKYNWSVEEALTTPNANDRVFKDHLGNVYNTRKEMLEEYGISKGIYDSRKKHGWSLEEILTTPILKPESKIKKKLVLNKVDKAPKIKNTKKSSKKKIRETIFDHLGNEFQTIVDMCNYWGISTHAFSSRVSRGMSIEEALTTPDKFKCEDHLGNKFSSKSEMARHYGMSASTIDARLGSGMSLEETLTTSVDCNPNKKCVDHLGNTFDTETSMCKYWNINLRTYRGRIDKGWEIKDALTIEKGGRYPQSNKCEDHLGNKFNTQKEMCRYWGIPKNTFRRRKEAGWDIKSILTTPLSSKTSISGWKLEKVIYQTDTEIFYLCVKGDYEDVLSSKELYKN